MRAASARPREAHISRVVQTSRTGDGGARTVSQTCPDGRFRSELTRTTIGDGDTALDPGGPGVQRGISMSSGRKLGVDIGRRDRSGDHAATGPTSQGGLLAGPVLPARLRLHQSPHGLRSGLLAGWPGEYPPEWPRYVGYRVVPTRRRQRPGLTMDALNQEGRLSGESDTHRCPTGGDQRPRLWGVAGAAFVCSENGVLVARPQLVSPRRAHATAVSEL